MKKRLGIVTVWAETGAGHVSMAYQKSLSEKFDIFIYARGTPNSSDSSIWNSPNVTRAPYHPCTTGIHTKHFKNWIKTNNISIIIFNEQRYWRPIIEAKKMGILCGAYIDYYTADTIDLFSIYDFLICNTLRHYSVFKHHKNSYFIPWGTDINKYKPNMKTKNINIVKFITSAGYTGSHSKTAPYMDRRGVGATLKAFKNTVGNAELIIYSQSQLKDCPTEWESIIASDKRIKFITGSFNPFPYTDGDIYIYPARLDGIGLTLPEALSSGLPAIVTNSPPMNEFVFDELNGSLVAVESFHGRPDGYYWPESICSIENLTAKIQKYIDTPSIAINQSQYAREYSEKNLDWSINSQSLSSIIENINPNQNIATNELFTKALKTDLAKNPTPIQKIILGIKNLFYTIQMHLSMR